MTGEALFLETFDRPPDSTSRASGRVNLIGEHTDYNGGLVLPVPIGRYTDVALAASSGRADEIVSARFGEAVSCDLSSPSTGHWTDYAVGALRAARTSGWIEGPQRLAIAGDLPVGAGLSSSASLVLAVLEASARAAGARPDARDLARMARRVENDHVGVPCGIMDPMAIAAGRPAHAMRLDTRTLQLEYEALPTDWRIAVVDSGVRRKLSEGRYAERRKECEQAALQLGVPFLCLLPEHLRAAASSLPDPLSRRARHAWSDHRRVDLAIRAIRDGAIERFGRILTEGHASLRDDFDVSTPAIDARVDFAVEAGAAGARLTGGGFGGCIVCVVPAKLCDDWSSRMRGSFEGISIVC